MMKKNTITRLTQDIRDKIKNWIQKEEAVNITRGSDGYLYIDSDVLIKILKYKAEYEIAIEKAEVEMQ